MTESQKQTTYILKNLPAIEYECGSKDLLTYRDGIFYIPDSNLEKFLSNLVKVSVSCRESRIYRFKSSPIIIKIPKKSIYHDNIIRTYYIGMELNKLHIPNFIRTLCLYSTHINQVMTAYDYIEGKSLFNSINDLSYKEYLKILIQVLFALEIAQRSCSFTHYDLHLGNVMCKPNKNSYTREVNIDRKVYKIKVSKYVPIIIDFGLASAKIKDNTIGSYEYVKYGITKKMYKGVDMYKFLFYSYMCSKGKLKESIKELFKFYGDTDPYSVIEATEKELNNGSKEYLKKIYNSKVSDRCPLEFVEWINK